MENSENDKDQIQGNHSSQDLFNAEETSLSRLNSERGGVVTARGTIDGVVLRLDGRAAQAALLPAVEDFLSTRESFLGGGDVLLEWVGAKPEESLVQELTKFLSDKFQITVKSSRLKEQGRAGSREVSREGEAESSSSIAGHQRRENKPTLVAPLENRKARSLFDGMEIMGNADMPPQRDSVMRGSSGSSAGFEAFWDDADARMIHSTLRSGQKIETDHSLIIFGDVNSGAEIVAGGDIIVLGTLRGVAHAGAYDETGGGRVIFALNLQPTQLRIGTVISRSANDLAQKTPEIARVEDGMIVVEGYSVKSLSRKM